MKLEVLSYKYYFCLPQAKQLTWNVLTELDLLCFSRLPNTDGGIEKNKIKHFLLQAHLNSDTSLPLQLIFTWSSFQSLCFNSLGEVKVSIGGWCHIYLCFLADGLSCARLVGVATSWCGLSMDCSCS